MTGDVVFAERVARLNLDQFQRGLCRVFQSVPRALRDIKVDSFSESMKVFSLRATRAVPRTTIQRPARCHAARRRPQAYGRRGHNPGNPEGHTGAPPH